MNIGDTFKTNVDGWQDCTWTVIEIYNSKYRNYPIVIGKHGICERNFKPDEIVA